MLWDINFHDAFNVSAVTIYFTVLAVIRNNVIMCVKSGDKDNESGPTSKCLCVGIAYG